MGVRDHANMPLKQAIECGDILRGILQASGRNETLTMTISRMRAGGKSIRFVVSDASGNELRSVEAAVAEGASWLKFMGEALAVLEEKRNG